MDFFLLFLNKKKETRETHIQEKRDNGRLGYSICTAYQAVLFDGVSIARIMLLRSSFRDTISKVKKQFQTDSRDQIHLIKYDSIDNLHMTNNKRSCSHIDLSNRRLILTRQHSRYTG